MFQSKVTSLQDQPLLPPLVRQRKIPTDFTENKESDQTKQLDVGKNKCDHRNLSVFLGKSPACQCFP